jgi:BirA family biotin operon repressor/biotin-[acetyl-CoA-carboxylase] ligase
MKIEIIGQLKKGKFISGETIGEKLGVSRTTIWKQINYLRKQGYNIKSIKNKGYKLISKPDIPLPEEIYNIIDTKIIGKNIIYLKKITSTNKYAKENIKSNFPEGTLIIADNQTEGRGRKNRKWLSPYGGLWFSLILYPEIPIQNSMFLTMICSISIADAIKKNINVQPIIKWPNDLLLNGKKICGILTELDAEIDKINYTIIGIGINVNNTIEKSLKNKATTLKEYYGNDISRVKLLKDIIIDLDKYYFLLKEKNYKKIKELWLSKSKIIGRKVKFLKKDTYIKGIVIDIDDNGSLIIKNHNKKYKMITGDIFYI